VAHGSAPAAAFRLGAAGVLRREPVLHHLLHRHRATHRPERLPFPVPGVAAARDRRPGAQLRAALRPAAAGPARVLEDDHLDRRALERPVLRGRHLRPRPRPGVDPGARPGLVRLHERGRADHPGGGALGDLPQPALRHGPPAQPAVAGPARGHDRPDVPRAPLHQTRRGPAAAGPAAAGPAAAGPAEA